MNIRPQSFALMKFATTIALTYAIGTVSHADLVHRYTFNDGTATDLAGTADGTLQGTASINLAGFLNLTGGGAGNSYADLPNGITSAAAAGGTSGAFSFEVWAQATTNAGWASLVSLGGADGQEDTNEGPIKDYFQLIPENGVNGNIRATTHAIDVGEEGFVDYTAPLSTSQEQHLAVVVDQTGGLPGTIDLYVDGVHVGQSEIASGLDASAMVDNNNWLGRSQWGDPSFNGSYNEFSMYDHALSATEISNNFLAGPEKPDLLTLVVNSTTGSASIRNDAAIPLDFSYYKITSEQDALDASNFGGGSGWNSLSDQNIDPVDGSDDDGIPGSRDTETWEEAGGSSSDLLVEFFVEGESILSPGETVSLGAPYNTNVFGAGNDGDLVFSFAQTGDPLIESVVEYVSGSLDGDFDGDNAVDGNDFLAWQRGESPNPLSASDLAAWQSSYGAGAVSAAVAVPEPNTIALFALGSILLATTRRRPAGRASGMVACLLSFAAFASVANADTTTDRLYRFGEGDQSPSIGDIVGNGLLAPDPTTLDSEGQSGTGNIQPLFALDAVNGGNDPRYVAPANSNVPGSNFAAEFDGNDFLYGRRLGLPSSSDPAVDLPSNGDDTDGLSPEDYSGIANRGFQLWVKPGSTGSLQSVVMDTNQHGVQITSSGNWSMRYGGSDYVSSESVTPGAWTHVMLVRPQGDAFGSRLFVDGNVVAAAIGGYDGADNARLVVGANTSDDEGMLGMSEFFTGVVDEFDMFIMGTNSADPPTDYGTFEVQTDNAFIASALQGNPQGDINLDGSVNNTDVNIFVSNWLSTPKEVNNIVVADLESYMSGDLDFDGEVNLDDAFLLHEGLQLAGSVGLDFSLLSVPEPTSVSLLLVGLISSISALAANRR